jgi:hypothetical protein
MPDPACLEAGKEPKTISYILDARPPEFDIEVITQANHQGEVYQAHYYRGLFQRVRSSNTFSRAQENGPFFWNSEEEGKNTASDFDLSFVKKQGL